MPPIDMTDTRMQAHADALGVVWERLTKGVLEAERSRGWYMGVVGGALEWATCVVGSRRKRGR